MVYSLHKHMGASTKYPAGPVLTWTHHAWLFFGEEKQVPGHGGRVAGREASDS